MIRLLHEFRLIPVVLVATGALLLLKTFGLIVDGGYILAPSDEAATLSVADSGDPADIVGTVDAPSKMEPAVPPAPPVTAPVVAGAAPPAPAKQSWAQEMFNFPDVTGSVGSTDKKPPAPAPAGKAPAGKDEPAGHGAAKPEGKSEDKPKPVKTAAKPPPDKADNLAEPHRMSPAERAILERLQDRRKELETRARELDMRETLIKAAEKRLDGKVNEIKQVEARIQTAVTKKDEEEGERFKGLIAMYENMKAKDAARIFDRLDLKILVDVASHIKPRQMADIMAQMNPEAAERLTVEFASRANTPRSQSPADLPKIEGHPTAPAR
jgi:flagellar motility protein MotE (MotC chaperone)